MKNMEYVSHYEPNKNIHCDPFSAVANYAGADRQASAMESGASRQAQLTMALAEMENQLRQGQFDRLSGQLPSFQNLNFGSLPTFSQAPDPTKYFGTQNITNSYNLAKQSLNQTLGQDVTDASSQAGALAAARGLVSPSSFVISAANKVRSAYAPQFSNLASQYQNNLNSGNQDLWKALFSSNQYNNQNQQYGFNNLMNLYNMNNQNSQNQFKNQFDLSNLRIGG